MIKEDCFAYKKIRTRRTKKKKSMVKHMCDALDVKPYKYCQNCKFYKNNKDYEKELNNLYGSTDTRKIKI